MLPVVLPVVLLMQVMMMTTCRTVCSTPDAPVRPPVGHWRSVCIMLHGAAAVLSLEGCPSKHSLSARLSVQPLLLVGVVGNMVYRLTGVTHSPQHQGGRTCTVVLTVGHSSRGWVVKVVGGE